MKPSSLRFLFLGLMFVTIPSAAEGLHHRFQVGVGGRPYEFTQQGCDEQQIRYAAQLVDVSLAYELSGGDADLQGLLDVQANVIHAIAEAVSGSDERHTQVAFAGRLMGGLRHEWIEVAVGIHGTTLNSAQFHTLSEPIYPAGRLRLFPEQYVYLIAHFLDTPSVAQQGYLQLGIGTRAIPRTLVEVDLGVFGPGIEDGGLIVPKAEVNVYEGLILGVWGAISIARPEDSGAGGTIGYGL